MESVRRADEAARGIVELELAAAGEDLTEAAIAREVPLALRTEGLLALGNSLSVRQVDGWCPPGRSSCRG